MVLWMRLRCLQVLWNLETVNLFVWFSNHVFHRPCRCQLILTKVGSGTIWRNCLKHLSDFGYDAIPTKFTFFAVGECFAPQPMHLQRRDASWYNLKITDKFHSFFFLKTRLMNPGITSWIYYRYFNFYRWITFYKIAYLQIWYKIIS